MFSSAARTRAANAAIAGRLGRDEHRLVAERTDTRGVTLALPEGAASLPPGDLAARPAQRHQDAAVPPRKAGGRAALAVRLLARWALAAGLGRQPELGLARRRRRAAGRASGQRRQSRRDREGNAHRTATSSPGAPTSLLAYVLDNGGRQVTLDDRINFAGPPPLWPVVTPADPGARAHLSFVSPACSPPDLFMVAAAAGPTRQDLPFGHEHRAIWLLSYTGGNWRPLEPPPPRGSSDELPLWSATDTGSPSSARPGRALAGVGRLYLLDLGARFSGHARVVGPIANVGATAATSTATTTGPHRSPGTATERRRPTPSHRSKADRERSPRLPDRRPRGRQINAAAIAAWRV